ncbi:uncharacterized protein LOC108457338 isoform X1 [Gossypium arboreum]|uniref:uncharacterized protein LOC108457338 isoform X1 n=1 Tax=Gossypium arboreum TaxID=29729 RepID=UPI000819774E|nr:uncharacterized protein LOC108457338 isoform X1 [Gossypium arboreum]
MQSTITIGFACDIHCYTKLLIVTESGIADQMRLTELILNDFLLLWFADDPNVPQVQHYRNFLKEHVGFKEVISLLKDDSTFIQELFARLRSPTTSAESKKNLEKPTTLDCSPRTICRRHIMAGSYLYKCI